MIPETEDELIVYDELVDDELMADEDEELELIVDDSPGYCIGGDWLETAELEEVELPG